MNRPKESDYTKVMPYIEAMIGFKVAEELKKEAEQRFHKWVISLIAAGYFNDNDSQSKQIVQS